MEQREFTGLPEHGALIRSHKMNSLIRVWFISFLPPADNRMKPAFKKKVVSKDSVLHRTREAPTAWSETPASVRRWQTTQLQQSIGAPFPRQPPLVRCCWWLFLWQMRVQGTVLWFLACFSAPELPQPLRAFFCIALSEAMLCYQTHTLHLLTSAWKEEKEIFFSLKVL